MARPHFSSNLFGTTQRLQRTVTVYNTPNTIASQGIIYRPSTASSTFGGGITFSSASRAAMDAHFDSNGTPGILDTSGNEEYGRIPVIYNYWGTGAPIGVRRSSAALLRFTGYVKTTGSYGLAVVGKGNVKVFHDDTSILYGSFDENNPKYLSSLRSFSAGDRIDIFYWGIDLNWSGIGVRVFTDSGAIDAEGEIDWVVMREAPILSASFMDDNQSVGTFELEDVISITTNTRAGQVRTMDIVIPQADTRAVAGWKWNNSTKKIVDQASSNEVRLGDLFQVSGGVLGDEHSLITGNVIDIIPAEGTITIKLTSVEGRLSQHLSENYPDRLSYAANGYTRRSGTSEPVWGVTAYDHWPMEYAIKDLMLRGWIDSSLLEGYNQVKRVGQSTVENGAKLLRIRGSGGDLIKLKRQANYGNPRGEDTTKPADDDYLYPSELTTTLYRRISELVETIGYDMGANEDGYVYVRPRNNATSVQQISGGTDTTNPSSIAGQYQAFTGTGWSVTINDVKASRIDLIVGRGASLGSVSVAVTRNEDAAVFNTVINTSHTEDVFYHDRVYDVNFDNITSYSILSGEEYGTYDIVITPLGGGPSTEYRLDALRVYDFDPETPRSDYTLSNLLNTTSITGNSNFSERINDAIVTGKRKSAITDSSRAIERIETEFITSRATDINAILNPTSVNYSGRKITAFLSDDSIGSQDLSDWAAQNLVAHYRLPNADATVEHTILPTIELRDPVKIVDARYDYFDGTSVYYVVGYTHILKTTSALTTLELSAFPETPSYEPKEDIDLSLYNNKPVINVDISYPSLNGISTISNPSDGLAVQSDLVVDTGTISGNALTVTAGVISPGTDLLYVEPTQGPLDVNSSVPFPDRGYYKNNPYHKFYTKTGSTLSLDFQMADGSAEYGPSGWGIGNGDEATFSSHIIQDAYSGTPPFYDPYYAELAVPEVVTITFDGLVSGYYRVSIVDARDPSDPTTVAWLTEPTASSTDARDHWEYRDSASNMQFLWDGVDNIGDWNKTQTEEYSWRQEGNFDTVELPLLGRGFYAANDQTTGVTHISSEVVGSQPAYPVGNYAQFFLRVEVLRDTDEIPLKVETNKAEDVLDSSASELTDRYIYYHLPPPNRATITISDWDISGGNYNPASPGNSWGGPDANVTIRDAKPVRITITPQQRKGTKFTSDESNASMKITRVVHLGANLYDLTAIFFGRKWNGKSLSAEEKRIVSRRYTVEDHSIEIADDSLNVNSDAVEWVFYPSLFEKDFGTGEEALEFMNFLQLSEVPSWNPKRLPGEERSRSLMTLMNYLFYFSVYTQDRSGRLVWCVDTSFVDKSKILTNTTPTTFPSDVERHQRRTIYVRQWWDHDILDQTHGSSGWNIPSNLRGGFADVWDYHVTSHVPLYPNSTGSLVSGSTITSFDDVYTDDLVSRGRHELLGGNTERDLGSLVSPLGNWTWENDEAAWVGNITRDFHPFYIVPPMSLAGYEGDYGGGRGPWWRQNYFYGIVDYRGNNNTGDEARFDSWFAIVNNYHYGVNGNTFIMAPGVTMEEYWTKKLADSPTDDPSKFVAVLDRRLAYQRQDDIKHYEMIRGGYSNGAGKSRDLLNVLGGSPYYQNVKLYRYFRMGVDLKDNMTTKWYNDVDRKGWFHVTFRHTYNWESSSLFPVDEDKFLIPGAIDSDLTGSPLTSYSYDPGAYTGWKDDHPSTLQGGTWIETGTCSTLHWRNDYTNHGEWWASVDAEAGGSCSIENPTVALSQEVLPRDYDLNQNIFLQRYVSSKWKQLAGSVQYNRKSYMPMAVGPRLPQTRRALFSLVLLNNRRGTSI